MNAIQRPIRGSNTQGNSRSLKIANRLGASRVVSDSSRNVTWRLALDASPRGCRVPSTPQLLAESTGNLGRGLIPLAGEPLGTPHNYGADRLFVYIELKGNSDPLQSEAVTAIERAGHPVVRIGVKDVSSLGGEFSRWEIAVAGCRSRRGIRIGHVADLPWGSSIRCRPPIAEMGCARLARG
jgi:hypothetical protein